MASRLGLSDAAREKLRQLNDTAKQRARTLKAEADQAKRELTEALNKKLPDHGRVSQHMDRLEQLKAELQAVWAKAQDKALALLSPEQRAHLERLTKGDLRLGNPPPTAAKHP